MGCIPNRAYDQGGLVGAHLEPLSHMHVICVCRYLEFPASAMSNILLNYSGACKGSSRP